MTKYKYIVWVGGSVIGEYDDEFDAEQVASEYRKDGYDDSVSVEIEEGLANIILEAVRFNEHINGFALQRGGV